MARTPLTLAALATAAVPGLDVVRSDRLGEADGENDAAILVARDGRTLVMRVPRTPAAEQTQAADLVALRALSDGVRSRLPFAVPRVIGQTLVDGVRGVVTEYLEGEPLRLGTLTPGHAASIGRAVAAIHGLPTSVVGDVGLPQWRPLDVVREAVTTLDRAAATGLVPASLLTRWESVTEDAAIWHFTPTVINGGLSAGALRAVGETVTGIVGWSRLQVGDPARDLFWILGSADPAVPEAAFDAYTAARGVHDRQVARRATFAAELEVARWLLHGTEQRSTEIVDDAVEMLHALLDRVGSNVMHPLADTVDVERRSGSLTEAIDLVDGGVAERSVRSSGVGGSDEGREEA